MDYRVVSTKLTEDEHAKFLEFCNKKGDSPFAAIKKAIDAFMQENNPSRELTLAELRKLLGSS